MFGRKKELEKKVEEKGKEKKEKKKTMVDGLPGTLPWAYLHKERGLTGEQLVNLKQAKADGEVDGLPATLVRIFDPAAAKEKGVTVEDYHSLNNYPELILYEGYYRTKSVRGVSIGGATDILIEKKSEWVPRR